MILMYLFTVIFGVLMMGSYLVSMVILNATVRDLLPKEHIGVFSGIRLIFFIMIPMMIGPFIGLKVIKNSNLTYTAEFGVLQSVPPADTFLAGSTVRLLAFSPIYFILKRMDTYYETI